MALAKATAARTSFQLLLAACGVPPAFAVGDGRGSGHAGVAIVMGRGVVSDKLVAPSVIACGVCHTDHDLLVFSGVSVVFESLAIRTASKALRHSEVTQMRSLQPKP